MKKKNMAGTFHLQTRRFIGAQLQWNAKNKIRDNITGRRAESLGRKSIAKIFILHPKNRKNANTPVQKTNNTGKA